MRPAVADPVHVDPQRRDTAARHRPGDAHADAPVGAARIRGRGRDQQGRPSRRRRAGRAAQHPDEPIRADGDDTFGQAVHLERRDGVCIPRGARVGPCTAGRRAARPSARDPVRDGFERRARQPRIRAIEQRPRPFRECFGRDVHAARLQRGAQRRAIVVTGVNQQHRAGQRAGLAHDPAQVERLEVVHEVGRVAMAKHVQARFVLLRVPDRRRRRIEPLALHERQLAQVRPAADDRRQRDDRIGVRSRVRVRRREHREQRARADADERQRVDVRLRAQRVDRVANAGDAGREAPRVEIIAGRIPRARVVETQRRDAVAGQPLRERARQLVGPQRFVAERLAQHDALPGMSFMQPAHAAVERYRLHLALLGIGDCYRMPASIPDAPRRPHLSLRP
ncbi:hypothetical protein BST28156_05713 [Burkholderia stagnalis]|nr:hypothetical protein BST28156_05713 [Burkholderia stagnalis]